MDPRKELANVMLGLGFNFRVRCVSGRVWLGL